MEATAGKHEKHASSTPPSDEYLPALATLSHKLNRVWVESVSIRPLTLAERTSETYWSVGLLWFSVNVNVLSFSTGTLAPVLGLNMKAALLTIFFFGMFCCIFPAYFSLFGARLGVRQMVFTRFSFGYAGTSLICLLNAATMLGYCILNTIVGGTTLSAVSLRADGSSPLTPTLGIVIASAVALLVSFSGIRVLHYFERWFWLPSLVAFCVLLGRTGTGPDALHVPADEPAPTPTGVLAMGSIMAGYIISYSALSSDVSHYLTPGTASGKIFLSVYLGFFLSCVPFIMLGAAYGCASIDNAAWSDALSQSSGHLFHLILTGGFGKFLTVILALSVTGNVSATLYSFGLTVQTMLPYAGRVPRFVWPILATAIFLPLAIVGAHRFYDTLSNFAAVLGYWSSMFIGVVMTDHLVVRRGSYHSYDLTAWNSWKRLPPGIAAVGACILTLGLLIPCIEQIWFTGPIAAKSGDLGFEVGLTLTALLYPPLRLLEKHFFGR